jgi:hypothetical protein
MMSRTLVLAELLINSWHDQSPRAESGDMGLPGGQIAIGRSHDTSDSHAVLDDRPSAPRLTSLIALGAVKWKSR